VQYPFEFAKTRLQLKSVGNAPKVGPVALLRQTIAEVGLGGIYVGCWTLVAVGHYELRLVVLSNISRHRARLSKLAFASWPLMPSKTASQTTRVA
jgi:solute carrier family 25 citrate transporter 1